MIANCLVRVRVAKCGSNIIAMEQHFAVNLNGANLPELWVVE